MAALDAAETAVKISRDWRPLVKELKAHGFVVVPGGRHYLIKNIEGKVVANLPCTASDHRALMNKRSELRQRGILPKAA